MSYDYIPDSAENLASWSSAALQEITPILPATVPALTAGKKSVLTDALTRIRDKAAAVVSARKLARAAEIALNEQRDIDIAIIHTEFADFKRMDGVTPELISRLEITSRSPSFEESRYKPILEVARESGYNLLTAKKRGVKAMSYYMRRQSTDAWTQIAANRTTSPVRDDAPPAVAGVLETRQYCCRGVINDVEVGEPSDIVEEVFGR